MSEWQPIETATKEHGFTALACFELDGKIVVHPVYFSTWNRGWRRKLDGVAVEGITHWMPLPEPPTT